MTQWRVVPASGDELGNAFQSPSIEAVQTGPPRARTSDVGTWATDGTAGTVCCVFSDGSPFLGARFPGYL